MEIIPLIILTIALTIGFGFVMAGSEAEAIKREWSNRRCEPYIVMTGGSYKPQTYEGSSWDFASENFNYCMGKFAKGAINTSMSPIFQSFGSVLGLGGVVGKIFNSLRQTIGELFRRFSSIFDVFFGIFNRFILQASRITQLLRASFLKMNAVMTTAIYMAISMLTLGINTFNLMILVTQIIVGILIGMAFILIFFMGPIGQILLALATTVGIALQIAIAIFQGELFEDYKKANGHDDYCFAAETQILMADGTTKAVGQLRAGDQLGNGCGTVRGTLTVDGSKVKLFSYRGIRVSGEHLVLSESGDKPLWSRVADALGAVDIPDTVDVIYCPVTTSQRLPVRSPDGSPILFADWEEMSDDEMLLWQKAVAKHLEVPEDEPLPNGEMAELGEDVCVYNIRGGWIPIKNIKINDMIEYLDAGGSYAPTRVVGIYKGDAKTLASPTDLGYGVWKEDNMRNWYKSAAPTNNLTEHSSSGLTAYHLITDSGVFTIMIPQQGRSCNVRDFTEVGHGNLARLTPDVVAQLNAAH
jgi:hypothetical protein